MNGFVSKTAFATIYGCGLSYVTKLKDLQKLVLSDDGKLVNVEASLRLIESTGDPSKLGVRERWNAYREGRTVPAVVAPLPPVESAPSSRRQNNDSNTSDYHKARTENEQINAEIKRMELRKLKGQIAEIEPMLKAITDTHVAARSALLQMPDRLAQLLAPETDPLKIHQILQGECERVCDVMLREIQRLRERSTVEVQA